MQLDVSRAPSAGAVSRAPLRWYLARLSAMSPAEVAWRARSGLRSRVDKAGRHRAALPRWDEGPWSSFLRELVRPYRDRLIADAARIAGGELDLWGHQVVVDPLRPAWDVDPLGGAPWRDGDRRRWDRDPKPLWELHRHQHLFPLAAGAALARNDAWAATSLGQLAHWIESNPPARGLAWASGYEAAHRLIAWAWSVPLIAPGAPPATLALIADSFARQARFVETHPSRYSSANNHRLAELAGLLSAAVLRSGSAEWRALWDDLEREVVRQTFADGGSREQAVGYHLYVIEILWVAGVLAYALGRGLGRVGDRLRAMLDWLEAVAGPDGEPPSIGDDAEDRALRVEYFERRRADAIAARAGALLAGRPSLAGEPPPERCERSRILEESGYAAFRARVGGVPVRVVVDVGELGLGSLAAHGHADALSVLLDVGERPLLRDSGTGSYAPAEGRDEFRSTGAHNTVVVDGMSQATPLGPHLWGRRFRTRLEASSLSPALDYVRASHDGYGCLPCGAIHTRSVVYLKPDLLVVLDRLRARRNCRAEVVWQLWPCDEPARLGDGIGAMAVVGIPPPQPARTRGRFSERYTWQREAPRFAWSACGTELVFATVVALSADGASPLPIALVRDGEALAVEIDAPRRVRVIERWRDATVEVVA